MALSHLFPLERTSVTTVVLAFPQKPSINELCPTAPRWHTAIRPLTVESRPRKQDHRPRIHLSCLVQSGSLASNSLDPLVGPATRGG